MKYVDYFIVSIFLIIYASSITSSYGLTESVELFGQINSADLILNDIWIEPRNPRTGEAVSIHGSLYNAGIVSTGSVSDVVTVGYIVNGEILEINVLEDIKPGIDNGIEISSGPILDARRGTYVITVIVNYHDTLSHLRDNPENNIIQKQFQILNENPLLISFDTYQKYDDNTNKQIVTVKGRLTDIFQEKISNQKISVEIGELVETVTTDMNGEFTVIKAIPFTNESIRVTTHVENNLGFPENPQYVFPVKIQEGQSGLALHVTSFTKNFENMPLTLVIFQDSYDNLFEKISTDEVNEYSMRVDNSFLTILPSNHEYIVEVYTEGRVIDAFQDNFTDHEINDREVVIDESAEVRFRVTDESGNPLENVTVNNWIYSTITDKDGFTEWIEVLPTITVNEPYIAKAEFLDEVLWSKPFLIENDEKKTIHIVHRGSK